MGCRAKQEFSPEEHLMAAKNLQICATSLGIREMQISKNNNNNNKIKFKKKNKKKERRDHGDSVGGLSEWLRSKTQIITVAGEDVEKPRHTSKISGTLSWNNHSGNHLEFPQKIRDWVTGGPSYTNPRIHLWCSKLCNGHLIHFVHSSID